MNEQAFEFLDDEISAASCARRVKQLKAIKGYLLAAKKFRSAFDPDLYRAADEFDIDCSRVEP
jgi:hypothetical protein